MIRRSQKSRVPFVEIFYGETPIDISDLLVSGVSNRADLNRVEAENIRKTLVKYFGGDSIKDVASFDFSWVQALHCEMFGEVWAWAGKFRSRDLNIGVPWQHIYENLYNLIEDLRFWECNGVDILEQAVRLHHAAVQIHPFLNGNGRWARMLSNIWLAVHLAPIVDWPDPWIGDSSPIRHEYLAALKAGDQGDLEPLMAIHRRYLDTD